MTRGEFLRGLETALNLPSNSLHGNENLDALAAWDSLGIVAFLAFLDKEFGVTVSTQELGKCTTVDDLVQLAGPGVQT